jgi:hypothetical protein
VVRADHANRRSLWHEYQNLEDARTYIARFLEEVYMHRRLHSAFISLLLSLRQSGTHKLWQNRKDKCYNDIKPDPLPSSLPLVQLKWGAKKGPSFGKHYIQLLSQAPLQQPKGGRACEAMHAGRSNLKSREPPALLGLLSVAGAVPIDEMQNARISSHRDASLSFCPCACQ